MRRLAAVLGLMLLVSAGCQTDSPFAPAPDAPADAMFAPVSMRIHPIFTDVDDWTGDGLADGVEAELEFLDGFGDPTKAAGKAVFELYDYRRDAPDPRGQRLVNPWVGSIGNLQEQRARWNRTSRTYSFQLAMPGLDPNGTYVLTAIFEPTGGGRFFDRTILTRTGRGNRNGGNGTPSPDIAPPPAPPVGPPNDETSQEEPPREPQPTTTTAPFNQPTERTPEP